MKFLCLNLWLGEVYTDTNTDANTNDADDAQSMIVQGPLVDKPNEPKSISGKSKVAWMR